MKITEVKIYVARNSGKLKAYVAIVIDNALILRDLKVIEGQNGLFISMPSRRLQDGKFKDIAHPLNHETRELIEKAVLEAYHHELEHGGGDSHYSSNDLD